MLDDDACRTFGTAPCRIFELLRLEICHVRQRTGEEIRHRRNPARASVTSTCSILCKTLSEQEKLRKIEGKNCFSTMLAGYRSVAPRKGSSRPSSDLNAMGRPMTLLKDPTQLTYEVIRLVTEEA